MIRSLLLSRGAPIFYSSIKKMFGLPRFAMGEVRRYMLLDSRVGSVSELAEFTTLYPTFASLFFSFPLLAMLLLG